MSAGHRALGSGFREVQRPMSVKRGPGISPDQAAEEGLCHQTCHAGAAKWPFRHPVTALNFCHVRFLLWALVHIYQDP